MPLDDLAPYQSLLLLRVKSGVTLSPLVEQMRDAVGGLVPKLVPTAILEPFADAQMEERVTATYVRYSEKRRATWSLTNEVEDQLNQLIVIARVRRLLALYASDSRIRTGLPEQSEIAGTGFDLGRPCPDITRRTKRGLRRWPSSNALAERGPPSFLDQGGCQGAGRHRPARRPRPA